MLVPTPPVRGAAQTDAEYLADINKYRTKGVVSSWFSSFGDAPDGGAEELREVSASIGAEYWYKNQFAFLSVTSVTAPGSQNHRKPKKILFNHKGEGA